MVYYIVSGLLLMLFLCPYMAINVNVHSIMSGNRLKPITLDLRLSISGYYTSYRLGKSIGVSLLCEVIATRTNRPLRALTACSDRCSAAVTTV